MLNKYMAECHRANKGFWHKPDGSGIVRNKGELLMLIVQDIAEAWLAEQRGLRDVDTKRSVVELKLMDAMIRIFEYASASKFDLDIAFEERMKLRAPQAGPPEAA
jgi:hypothetical protein